MPVQVRYFSDPACPWSWSAEPKLRRLEREFPAQIEFRPVMGGLARHFGPEYSDSQSAIKPGPDWALELAGSWMEAAARGGMPCDPRIWVERPPAGSFVAGMAVVAAGEQGPAAAAALLRRLREALYCERRRADSAEAVQALAAELPPGRLDLDRFAIDLASTAILERFGQDLELTRTIPPEAREAGAVHQTEGHERLALPALQFLPRGERFGAAPREGLPAVWDLAAQPYEALREAALAAGAEPADPGPADPRAAIESFTPRGRLATAELEALTGLPRPPLEAELWRLAAEWRLKPVPVLTGTLWQLP